MLSDELLGIERISREDKMNTGKAANLIALGKILRDSGVDANVLSNVSMQLKGYDEAYTQKSAGDTESQGAGGEHSGC